MWFEPLGDVETDVTKPYLRIDDDPTTIFDLDLDLDLDLDDEEEKKVIVDELALARGSTQIPTLEMRGMRQRMDTRDQLLLSYDLALLRFR